MYFARYNVSQTHVLFCFLFYCSVSVKLNYLNLFSGTHCSLCVYMSPFISDSAAFPDLCDILATSEVRIETLLLLIQQFAFFFLVKRVKCNTILKSPPKQLNPRPRIFSVNGSIIWQFYCTIDVIFHLSQNSFKFGGQQLVMMNFACHFSQSETEKYFE